MEQKFKNMSMVEIFSMEPEELRKAGVKQFPIHIPDSIETVEDMAVAGKLLGRYTSWYSYFTGMALAAKLRKRTLKQEKADKKVIEEALSREEIFTNYADIAKSAYNAISRMFAIKQEINNELRMTDGK